MRTNLEFLFDVRLSSLEEEHPCQVPPPTFCELWLEDCLILFLEGEDSWFQLRSTTETETVAIASQNRKSRPTNAGS